MGGRKKGRKEVGGTEEGEVKKEINHAESSRYNVVTKNKGKTGNKNVHGTLRN